MLLGFDQGPSLSSVSGIGSPAGRAAYSGGDGVGMAMVTACVKKHESDSCMLSNRARLTFRASLTGLRLPGSSAGLIRIWPRFLEPS
jgi:hypothetical protein